MKSQTEKERQNALNEVRLMSGIKDDDFIVQYKEAFLDNESETLCLVMDYAEEGDAFSLIKQGK